VNIELIAQGVEMKRRVQILVGAILLLGSYGLARVGAGNGGAHSEANPPTAFAVARVVFEENATDKDAEVVFEAMGGGEGLAKLTVVSPDGRTIVDFTGPGDSKLGIRQFRFESPEPKDIASIKAAYPEGAYTFTATTASGKKLESKATLSHKLPVSPSFLKPGANAEGVSAKNLEITWTPVKNVAAYMIYIEQEESGMNIEAKLPGSMAKFAVPDGFLLPGTEYTLGIGTVGNGGNSSFVETSFTTAGKEQ
jgi:hypothetical protein